MHAYQEGKFCFDEISRVFSSKSISFKKKKKLKVVGLFTVYQDTYYYIFETVQK
jgi:hypothetical protein